MTNVSLCYRPILSTQLRGQETIENLHNRLLQIERSPEQAEKIQQEREAFIQDQKIAREERREKRVSEKKRRRNVQDRLRRSAAGAETTALEKGRVEKTGAGGLGPVVGVRLRVEKTTPSKDDADAGVDVYDDDEDEDLWEEDEEGPELPAHLDFFDPAMPKDAVADAHAGALIQLHASYNAQFAAFLAHLAYMREKARIEAMLESKVCLSIFQLQLHSSVAVEVQRTTHHDVEVQRTTHHVADPYH